MGKQRRKGLSDKINTFDKLFQTAKDKLCIKTFSDLAGSLQAAGYLREYKKDTLAQYMRECRYDRISRVDSKYMIFCAISTIIKDLEEFS